MYALLQTKRKCIFTDIQFSYKNQNLNSDFQKEFPDGISRKNLYSHVRPHFDHCTTLNDSFRSMLKSSVYFPKISGQELSKPSKIAVLSCMKKTSIALNCSNGHPKLFHSVPDD